MLYYTILVIISLLLLAVILKILKITLMPDLLKSPGKDDSKTVVLIKSIITKFAFNNEPANQELSSLPATLTPREKEVALLLLSGCSRSEIAAILSISKDTVNSHCKKIYMKTGCDSQVRFMSRYSLS